jgi:hypothetical protein
LIGSRVKTTWVPGAFQLWVRGSQRAPGAPTAAARELRLGAGGAGGVRGEEVDQVLVVYLEVAHAHEELAALAVFDAVEDVAHRQRDDAGLLRGALRVRLAALSTTLLLCVKTRFN